MLLFLALYIFYQTFLLTSDNTIYTEARLLLDTAGGLILSSDNPLDFHPEI